MSRSVRAVMPGRSAGGELPRGLWLTRAAFVLALGLVLARCMMLETLRDPFAVSVGTQPVPRGAGAAAGVVLDALCWVPALLVLIRRVVDPAYRLRLAWSQLWLALLALWAMASTGWAGDRFGAAVGSFHFLSAAVLFFAAAQVVRTWARLRLLAGVCFGLLLVFATHGLYYRFVDLPDLQQSWEKNKAQILQDRGWEPDSFAARQFEKKIVGGEMMGFSASPNTFAALIVLTSLVTTGILIQRLADHDGAAWLAAYLPGMAAGIAVMAYAQSKAAGAALAMGVAILGGLFAFRGVRRWMGRHARAGFVLGVAAVLLAVAAVVGHGLYHHSLPTDSLNFRWRYWVGSVPLFERHPIAGVGWNNFGAHYLATRLPAASEEIKDPHNLVLRFVLELGVIGGVLMALWMLWTWWDLTRPVLPAADDSPLRLWVERGGRSPIGRIAVIAILAVAINIAASLDFNQGWAFAVIELFKRGLFLCVLLIGTALASLKRLEQTEPDGRFAGWELHALLVALGLFLVQSMIDVAFFEIGAMFLFFLLAGGALGMRLKENAEKPRKSAMAAGALAGVSVAWLAGIVMMVAPVVRGEALAVSGDDELRARRPDLAEQDYQAAYSAVPWDAEYANRATKAAIYAGNLPAALQWIDRAIAVDPTAIEYYLTRAQLELARPDREVAAARADYEKALALNPNDVSIRVTYGDILSQLGFKDDAREQYRIALERNAELDKAEPKRLPEKEIERIHAAMQ